MNLVIIIFLNGLNNNFIKTNYPNNKNMNGGILCLNKSHGVMSIIYGNKFVITFRTLLIFNLPLIIHSDRSSQYVSNALREATEKMQRSYSHSGYPYDNACIESFHSLIKRERLNRFHIINYKHAYRLVFEYIETFYHTKSRKPSRSTA